MDNERFKIIKKLFSAINTIRLVIINIIFFGFFIIFFAGISSITNKGAGSKPIVEAGTVLLIQPRGIILEKQYSKSLSEQLLVNDEYVTSLDKITKSIEEAAYNRRVSSLIFDFSKIQSMSLSSAYEIKLALEEFRGKDKPYYAFNTYYNLASYYLASSANRLCLDPFGDINFSGFASQGMFLGGMAEKTGIKYSVSKAGTYKGAADTYTEKSFTADVRKNYNDVLSSFWEYFLRSCSENSAIKKEAISTYAEDPLTLLEKSKGNCTKALLDAGLVSDVLSFPDFLKTLNIDESTLMSFSDFYKTIESISSKNAIYIINLDGAITSSASDIYSTDIASDTAIIKSFEEACADTQTKAIVLRINSGGGEVFASEKIRREVEKVRTEHKIPVIVSMGSVAASGAYWIASNSDYIYANPFTLTGSIGVLASIPNVSGLLERYFGITSDLVYKGAKPQSVLKELDAYDMRVMQLQISDIYDKFLQTVSKGRSIPKENVAVLASGKVYSASQALDLKLIDKIGGLEDAIYYAADVCDIKNDYKVKTLETKRSILEGLLNIASESKISLNKLPALEAGLDLLSLQEKNRFLLYEAFRLEQF